MPLLFTSCYYTTQAYYLFNYTYDKAEKISDILQDSNTPEDTKTFLELVLSIKNFIKNNTSLAISKNYNTYVELDRNYLVAVVQAAPQLSLNSYMWNYPFLGKLPYRGYYNIEAARKEANKLKGKQYDTIIRPVRAFSTLSILSDPLYSFMKEYQEYDLAELIAHEQTHATIWVKKQSEFNEQLANFVGKKIAEQYIYTKYGIQSQEYKSISKEKSNSTVFIKFLYDIRLSLESMYANESLSTEEKLKRKKQLLENAQNNFLKNYNSMFSDDSYKHVDITRYNNAFFSTIALYEDNLSQFEEAYKQCNKNITLFIDTMKQVKKNSYKKNPHDFLKIMCK